jgi:D-alanine-D-alanine ligase
LGITQPVNAGQGGAGQAAIGVLMGGCSRERDVSLDSGRMVAEALRSAGHDVRAVDVKPGDITPDLVAGLDVIFLALHGRWGEDGGIQSELEALGACYTFSGPAASRLAMDKVRAKERFLDKEIPTPPYRVAQAGDEPALDEAFASLGAPLIVKPVADGSSIGLGLAGTREELRQAVRKVWAMGDPALIERRIVGREFTVGVLGDAALPVLEIVAPGGVYDYKNKYVSDQTQYVFEHGLPADVDARMRALALASHRALGCRDLSRVDIMLSGQGEMGVLEVNTIPGFTSHSLVPKAAARQGLPLPALCEQIVAMALRRGKHPARDRRSLGGLEVKVGGLKS